MHLFSIENVMRVKNNLFGWKYEYAMLPLRYQFQHPNNTLIACELASLSESHYIELEFV